MICKQETTLCEHHIFKRIVFGENSKVGYICESCHERVDNSIKVFESEVLNKFSYCNVAIWKSYAENGNISEGYIKKITRERFKRIQNNSFNIKHKNPSKEPLRIKKEFLNKEQTDFYNQQICPICGRKKKLTIHHIQKWIIFKDNSMLGFPCRQCHNAIEKSVSLFETEVLKHFKASYRFIWQSYYKNGYIPDIEIRRMAKAQFVKVKNKLTEKTNKRQEYIIKKTIEKINSDRVLSLIKERSIPA